MSRGTPPLTHGKPTESAPIPRFSAPEDLPALDAASFRP